MAPKGLYERVRWVRVTNSNRTAFAERGEATRAETSTSFRTSNHRTQGGSAEVTRRDPSKISPWPPGCVAARFGGEEDTNVGTSGALYSPRATNYICLIPQYQQVGKLQ